MIENRKRNRMMLRLACQAQGSARRLHAEIEALMSQDLVDDRRIG